MHSHLTSWNLEPVVNAIVRAVEQLCEHVPGEDDPGDGLLLPAAADVVSPVKHPLAAADELLKRGLAQLADIGIEGPQQRLGHRHPVLPGDPSRLGGRVEVATQGNLWLEFLWHDNGA